MVKKKAKMITLEQRAVASFHWDEHEEARIERNLFAHNGDTWEALRFCKNRDGRHNRVHLVIGEAQFVDLFRDAVEKGVFHPATLERLSAILTHRRDPLLEVIGSAADGQLTTAIDDELYDDKSP
jgi:hypothetical protein